MNPSCVPCSCNKANYLRSEYYGNPFKYYTLLRQSRTEVAAACAGTPAYATESSLRGAEARGAPPGSPSAAAPPPSTGQQGGDAHPTALGRTGHVSAAAASAGAGPLRYRKQSSLLSVLLEQVKSKSGTSSEKLARGGGGRVQASGLSSAGSLHSIESFSMASFSADVAASFAKTSSGRGGSGHDAAVVGLGPAPQGTPFVRAAAQAQAAAADPDKLALSFVDSYYYFNHVGWAHDTGLIAPMVLMEPNMRCVYSRTAAEGSLATPHHRLHTCWNYMQWQLGTHSSVALMRLALGVLEVTMERLRLMAERGIVLAPPQSPATASPPHPSMAVPAPPPRLDLRWEVHGFRLKVTVEESPGLKRPGSTELCLITMHNVQVKMTNQVGGEWGPVRGGTSG